MRILHVIAQKPSCTGSGIFLNEMLRQSYTHGYENWIVAGIEAGENLQGIDSQWLSGRSIVHFNTNELPFHVVGMSDDMPYPSTRYKDMDAGMCDAWEKAFTEALKDAAGFKPDRIWIHHIWELVPIVQSVFEGTPMTVFSHGTELRQMEEVSLERRESVRRSAERLQDIIALNEVQANRISTVYGIERRCIRVVGAGFESSLFYPIPLRTQSCDESGDLVQVVYAGKLSPAKGVGELLQAFAKMGSSLTELEGYRVGLDLIGTSDPSNLQRYVTLSEMINARVRFLGALPHEDLAERFRSSGVFVLPSYFEGASLVTLEALASGMRVVVNELPEIKAWIPEKAVESGRVIFVRMPGLIGCDNPVEEDIPKYVDRLAHAIKVQCIRHISDVHERMETADTERLEIFKILNDRWSWSMVFAMIIQGPVVDIEL